MVTMNSIIASLRVCALVRMHNVHLLQRSSLVPHAVLLLLAALLSVVG